MTIVNIRTFYDGFFAGVNDNGQVVTSAHNTLKECHNALIRMGYKMNSECYYK